MLAVRCSDRGATAVADRDPGPAIIAMASGDTIAITDAITDAVTATITIANAIADAVPTTITVTTTDSSTAARSRTATSAPTTPTSAHLAALLTVPAFILLAATYVPRNQIQAALHHPMVLGVQLWALAHLLANGTQVDVLLFGAFLAWALLSFLAARRRDRAEGRSYPAGRPVMTLVAVAAGAGLWAAFALWLHERWIGVAPLG